MQVAWSKLKSTVVAGAILLLAAGTTTLVVHSVGVARSKAALANLEGSWEGTLSVGQAKLRLVLRIFKTNDTVRAELDSIDQGALGVTVTKLSA